jgi:polyisoprenyl-phosphate glycosyltransferase
MVELSVVIPVYGCRGCLAALHERLTTTLEALTPSYEIVFVDDRSRDGAWDVLVSMARLDSHVRAIRLSRNFGQHVAITAGLTESTGRWTVVMDCDLQEPPEVIPQLYAKAREGFEIVLTTRVSRSQRRWRKLAARAYFGVQNFVLGTDVGPNHGTLSILSRKAVAAFLSVTGREREYLLILSWLGFDPAIVTFAQEDRHEGRSAYTLRGLLRLSMDGLLFQTTRLLRWVVYVGFGIAGAGLVLATYFVAVYLTDERSPPGYTSIAVLLLLLSGFIITSLGVVALYVGRIFEQGKGRPLYVVDGRTDDDAREADATPAPEAAHLDS